MRCGSRSGPYVVQRLLENKQRVRIIVYCFTTRGWDFPPYFSHLITQHDRLA
jgi:hypothetical protein